MQQPPPGQPPPPGPAGYLPGTHPAGYQVGVGMATNTMAIVSLAVGAGGFVIPIPFAGIVAIITGHMARHQIRQTGEQGGNLATVGIILGWIHVALSALLVVGLIVFLLFFVTAAHTVGGASL